MKHPECAVQRVFTFQEFGREVGHLKEGSISKILRPDNYTNNSQFQSWVTNVSSVRPLEERFTMVVELQL